MKKDISPSCIEVVFLSTQIFILLLTLSEDMKKWFVSSFGNLEEKSEVWALLGAY